VIATGTYFAIRDDVSTRLIDRLTKISSENQISDLRAEVVRLTSRLDRDWVRAAKLEQFTNDLSTRANGGPASTIDPAPLPSNVETPSEPIVATAQTAEHAVSKKKKSRASNRRRARVIPTQQAPTVAGTNHVSAEPVAGQQNYY
jgi:hypothetical protein